MECMGSILPCHFLRTHADITVVPHVGHSNDKHFTIGCFMWIYVYSTSYPTYPSVFTLTGLEHLVFDLELDVNRLWFYTGGMLCLLYDVGMVVQLEHYINCNAIAKIGNVMLYGPFSTVRQACNSYLPTTPFFQESLRFSGFLDPKNRSTPIFHIFSARQKSI